MATSDERRRNTRVSFETIIDLTCGEKSFPGCQTDNLSTKGVLIFGISMIYATSPSTSQAVRISVSI